MRAIALFAVLVLIGIVVADRKPNEDVNDQFFPLECSGCGNKARIHEREGVFEVYCPKCKNKAKGKTLASTTREWNVMQSVPWFGTNGYRK